MLVREFQASDAEDLSRLIVHNLRVVNSKDYSPEGIEALIPFFTPARLKAMAKKAHSIVGLRNEVLVGTASLEGDRVRNVFVAVDLHGKGIGRTLMSELETVAKAQGERRLQLHASLAAEGFYRVLGYRVRAPIERELEGTVIQELLMEKDL